MEKKNRSYARMEKNMTSALLISAVCFLIFLFASGYGVTWLKVICAIFSILIPLICFGMLYLSQEWRKRRSQWMSVAAAALVICTIFSLILQFPSPAP